MLLFIIGDGIGIKYGDRQKWLYVSGEDIEKYYVLL